MKFRDILKRLSRPISLEHLTDYEVYDDGDTFRTGKVILPTGQIDTSTGKIAINEDLRVAIDTPTDNSDAEVGPENGEIWLAVGGWVCFICDANVADRSARMQIYAHNPFSFSMGNPLVFRSAALSLQASQEGVVEGTMASSGDQWRNDNNAVSRQSLYAPFPRYMRSGGYMQADYYANTQVGDRARAILLYYKVGQE